MASAIERPVSRTAEIVQYLEGEILSGRLSPMAKIKGTRELAEQFHVSQPLVLQALRELEKRRLIYRRERRGVFVSATASEPEVREVLYLIFALSPRNVFVREVIDVAFSPEAAETVNFQLRTVHIRSDAPSYRTRILRDEVARLATRHHDAAVVLGIERREEVEAVLGLPFPVLFAGDFPNGDYPGLHYNRLGFSRPYFHPALDRARETGGKKIALLFRSQQPVERNLKEALQEFVREAEAEGIECRLYPVVVSSLAPAEEQDAVRHAVIAELERSGFRPNIIHQLWLLNPNRWIDDIRASAIPLEAGKHEIVVDGTVRLDRDPAIRYASLGAEGRDEMNRFQLDLIRRLADDKLNDYRGNYAYPVQLT